MEPNLINFKWGSRVNRHSPSKKKRMSLQLHISLQAKTLPYRQRPNPIKLFQPCPTNLAVKTKLIYNIQRDGTQTTWSVKGRGGIPCKTMLNRDGETWYIRCFSFSFFCWNRGETLHIRDSLLMSNDYLFLVLAAPSLRSQSPFLSLSAIGTHWLTLYRIFVIKCSNDDKCSLVT